MLIGPSRERRYINALVVHELQRADGDASAFDSGNNALSGDAVKVACFQAFSCIRFESFDNGFSKRMFASALRRGEEKRVALLELKHQQIAARSGALNPALAAEIAAAKARMEAYAAKLAALSPRAAAAQAPPQDGPGTLVSLGRLSLANKDRDQKKDRTPWQPPPSPSISSV